MLQTLLSRFKSRKFVTALIGTLIAYAEHYLDMPPELIALTAGMFGAAILGDAYEDGKAKGAGAVNVGATGTVNVQNPAPSSMPPSTPTPS